jgi:hypothetical protein
VRRARHDHPASRLNAITAILIIVRSTNWDNGVEADGMAICQRAAQQRIRRLRIAVDHRCTGGADAATTAAGAKRSRLCSRTGPGCRLFGARPTMRLSSLDAARAADGTAKPPRAA